MSEPPNFTDAFKKDPQVQKITKKIIEFVDSSDKGSFKSSSISVLSAKQILMELDKKQKFKISPQNSKQNHSYDK